jgi:hypothetical protein
LKPSARRLQIALDKHAQDSKLAAHHYSQAIVASRHELILLQIDEAQKET